MSGFLTRRRRARLRSSAIPRRWRSILLRNFALYGRLSPADQRELDGHMQVLIAEKNWEGCGGLTLDDEIRVTVAAQASLLLLHRDADYFPRVTSILIYPTSYIARGERSIGGGIWEEGEEERLGHTQQQLGAVVLAWDAALHGARNDGDGQNVVLHEFAHQLDFENNVTDGTPILSDPGQYASWARVLGREFDRLRRGDAGEDAPLLDQYGAQNPAEFFAVATEFFFERPVELKERHPELYEEFRAFYRQNPVEYAT